MAHMIQALFNSGEYAACLEDARKALELVPDAPKAMYRAGLASLMLELPADAGGYLKSFVKQQKMIKMSTDGKECASCEISSSATTFLRRAELLAAQEASIAAWKKSCLKDNAGVSIRDDEIQNVGADIKELYACLNSLEEDVDGNGDVDVPDTLIRLQALLERSSECRDAFSAQNGFRLIWYFFSESSCREAGNALKAASQIGPGCINTPLSLWSRLLSFVIGKDEVSPHVIAAVMDVLQSAAREDVWIRTQLLTHPMPGNTAIVPICHILHAISLKRFEATSMGRRDAGFTPSSLGCIAAEEIGVKGHIAAADLIRSFCLSSESILALKNLNFAPLQSCLTAYSLAYDVAAADPKPYSKGNDCETKLANHQAELSTEELEARESLLRKRNEVFNLEAVRIRHAYLRTVLSLMKASRDLALDECLNRKSQTSHNTHKKSSNGSKHSSTAKSTVTMGPLIPLLLDVLRELISQSPNRTVAVLGPDGQPAAYTKRPFAADFKDNPVGDFLTTLSLDDSDLGEGQNQTCLSGPTDPSNPTLLERCLEAVEIVANLSQATAVICHKEGLISACQKLMEFLTIEVSERAQRLCARLCDACPAAAEDALHEGTVHCLTAIVKYCGRSTIVDKATDKIVSLVDACSGDDFAMLTGSNGVLPQLFLKTQKGAALRKESNEKSSHDSVARKLLLRCAERAQRYHGAGAFSRGGWKDLDRESLLRILRPSTTASKAKSAMTSESNQPKNDFKDMKRGFFKASNAANGGDVSKRTNARGSADSSNALSSSMADRHCKPDVEVVRYENGVTFEDITDVEESRLPTSGSAKTQSHKTLRREPAPVISTTLNREASSTVDRTEQLPDDNCDTPEDITDLQDVFDSSPAMAVRSARAAWMNVPLKEKFRWDQTSSDVSLWLMVPHGTKASEISVQVKPNHIVISLNWFGKVLDESLHASVKSCESTWCLEGSSGIATALQGKGDFPEIHIILPKDGHGRWWKALFQNGEEKGYYELLQDAVNAGMPSSCVSLGFSY